MNQKLNLCTKDFPCKEYSSICADCNSRVENGKVCVCQSEKFPFRGAADVFSSEIDVFNDYEN